MAQHSVVAGDQADELRCSGMRMGMTVDIVQCGVESMVSGWLVIVIVM